MVIENPRSVFVLDGLVEARGVSNILIEPAYAANPVDDNLIGNVRCRARPLDAPPRCNNLRSLRAVDPRGPASPLHAQQKTPFSHVFCCVMEARGVEPLSEDNATQASTGVVAVLMSP